MKSVRDGILFLLCILVLPVACNKKKSIPFPEDENEFAKPVTKEFAFSKTVDLIYTDKPDNIRPVKTIPFELDKLPAKPFTINDFKPLKKKVQTGSLNWDQLPDSLADFNKRPAKPYLTNKTFLPDPVIVKTALPKPLPGTTAALLQFSEEEGLPGAKITASIIDKNGTKWLATDKGLCRYLGENIAIYQIPNKNAESGSAVITHMALDKEGNIWATTDRQGIYTIDIAHGIIYHDGSAILGLDIICDHAGKIWIGTWGEGLLIIDKEKQTIKNIKKYNERIAANSIGALLEDRNKNIWFNTFDNAANNILVINPARTSLKLITGHQKRAISFFENSDGEICVGNLPGSIDFISLKNNTISTLGEDNGFSLRPWLVTEDNQGKTWAVANDTVCVINKTRDSVKNIITNATAINQLKGSLMKDENENIWIGTLDKGMILINNKAPGAEHLGKENGLTDPNIWGILEDKQSNIWIGTENGVNIYQPGKNSMAQLTHVQGLPNNNTGRFMEDDQHNIFISTAAGFAVVNIPAKTLSSYSSAQFLTEDYYTYCFLKDSTGRLWVDALNQGLIIYDLHENTIKKLDKTGGLLSTKIWDLKTDRYGNIWVGSDSGISIIDPGRTKVKYLRESEGLVNNQVWTIGTFANGEIWIGTQKGISIIDTGQTKITNLTANEGLVPDAIYNILELNGHTYAATSNGLVMVKRPSGNGNKQHWNFFNYEKRQGLLFNNYNTNAGTITKSGKIWLGAIPELNIINEPPLIDSVKPQVYITGVNIMDQSSSFTDRASVFDHLQAGDSIWDQSKNKYYLKNTFPVAVSYPAKNNIHWDSTEGIFNIPVGLTLPFDQNSISFSFANMNISGRDKIMYRYILEGIDNKWSNADPKNSTKIYYNLAPGKYTFRVSTKDFNGQWSKTAGFDFTIRPPWWQTWWAYLLYVLAAVFIITAYSQYRSRNLRNKNIELEDKISQRTSELKNSLDELKSTQSQLIQSEKMASLGELTAGIAHEIQNPLNFVNNFSDVNKELLDELKEEAGKGNMNEVIALANDVIANEEKINHHGKRADAIVKGMLQHSRSSSGQKEPTNINALADEYFRLAYHGLRAKDKSFNATLKTDYDESIGNINIIPQDIGRVILNLITNAFYAVTEKAVLAKASADKYEPTVSISTKKINGKVELRVKDNGNGIPQKVLDKIFQPFFTTKPTGQGTGLGLSLSYDIIKAHGGELKAETKENEGAEFIILFSLI